MTFAEPQSEPEFAQAAQSWQLETLYIDLAAAKGRGLTPLEKNFSGRLLCGYSPAEIAAKVYQSRSSSAVRVYLSNGLYKYLQELLIRKTGQAEKIKSWSRVTHLLEKVGYRKGYVSDAQETFRPSEQQLIDSRTIAPAHQYWQERVDVDHFLGREQELAQLQQWIVQKRCRVVAIWGMGGLGKTTLAVKLVEEIQAQFEYVIWRSLREAPLFEEQIAGLLQCLDSTGVSERLAASAKLAYLMEILRSHRCLMVFNQFETVLAPNQRAGVYREGYQGYGGIVKTLSPRTSSQLLSSNNARKPDEVALFEGNNTQVRSLFLDGLTSKIAQQLLTPQNLIGSETEKQFFVSFCANNPLVIRMASLAIQNLFNNNLTKFLATKPLLLYDIRQLLEQQFSRLSSQEKQMMYALAVSQRLTQLQGSKKELTLDFSLQEQLETLESLQKRSLIQPNSVNLAQPSLLKTYILEKLIEEVEAETYNQDIGLIVKDLLRETLLVTEQQASREFKKYG